MSPLSIEEEVIEELAGREGIYSGVHAAGTGFPIGPLFLTQEYTHQT